MKVSIEAVISILIVALMALFSTCFITAAGNTRNAQDFHASVIAEVEASDFDPDVIATCESEALDYGFVKIQNGNKVSGLEITDYEGANQGSMKKVTLTYDYTIPILNLFLQHEIVGYAR